MPVGKLLPKRSGIYFCTFSCWGHHHLIARTNLYDAIYEKLERWVDKGCTVVGYVIMPNHVHLLIHVPEQHSVNQVLSDCKRWLAKVMIDRLTLAKDEFMLFNLQRNVDSSRYTKGQWHRAWEPSSDIKLCFNERMIEQKLLYIHNNPLQAHWELASRAEHYPHSSAGFYATGAGENARIQHWSSVYR